MRTSEALPPEIEEKLEMYGSLIYNGRLLVAAPAPDKGKRAAPQKSQAPEETELEVTEDE